MEQNYTKGSEIVHWTLGKRVLLIFFFFLGGGRQNLFKLENLGRQ